MSDSLIAAFKYGFVQINIMMPHILSDLLQKRQNITMLVNSLYINFSDGSQQNIQEYELQCDAQRKVAMANIITVEERIRLNEEARRAQESKNKTVAEESEPHDTSDIIFISICVLAVILMLIAIVWLVLL